MTNEDPLIRRLMTTTIPLVTASLPFPGSDIPSADTDTLEGPVTQMRLDGFHQGAKNAAIGHTTVNGWTPAAGERAMSELLERCPDLDGVVTASDLHATGAIRALSEAGRRVPQDVGMVGFDDAPVAALNDPPLSTVRSDAKATGAALADMAVAQIRGQKLLQRHLVLPNDIVWRESA